MRHRNVRQIHADGTSTLSEYWLKKLHQWVFPKLRIYAEKDKQAVVKELDAVMAKWPKASQKEIEQYAEDSKRFLSQTAREDKYGIKGLRSEVNTIVNAVALLQEEKKSSRGSTSSRDKPRDEEKSKRGNRWELVDSDSEDEEDDSDSDTSMESCE